MAHLKVFHQANTATLADGFGRTGVRPNSQLRVDAGLRQHGLDEEAFLRARAEREELGLASRERNN
eukprot:8201890-Heterocapsa_arctica.AAC.1